MKMQLSFASMILWAARATRALHQATCLWVPICMLRCSCHADMRLQLTSFVCGITY